MPCPYSPIFRLSDWPTSVGYSRFGQGLFDEPRLRGGIELFSDDPPRGHHGKIGQLPAKLEASLLRLLAQGCLRAREVLLGLLAGFLLRPGNSGLGDLPRLADDLLRLLSRLDEDLLVADAGPRHLRLHGIGGGHAL